MCDEEKNSNNEIGLIYKNLQYISQATYSAESVMLGWETIYALIEGQLIIAYFDKIQSNIIISAGLLFACMWLILVDM
jgi:hypothetical protein